MATLTHVGRVNDNHRSYGKLAAWIEHHGWQISGEGRDILIQLPQPEKQGEAVIEVQLPVTRCDHPAIPI
jgi:effector-binding domain-containing protein